jgi:hypothetical protein
LRTTPVFLAHERYPASTLLRSGPPPDAVSIFSASQFEPLVPFPVTSPHRFVPYKSLVELRAAYMLGQSQDIPQVDPGERVTPEGINMIVEKALNARIGIIAVCDNTGLGVMAPIKNLT